MRPLVEASTFVSTVPAPEDGDEGDAASVNGALQGLTDRTRYLLDAVPNGLLLGGRRLRSTPDADGVVLGPIAGLWLGGRVYREPASITLGADRAAPPGFTGARAEVRWWFLYAFADAARLGYEYSRTPPDAALLFRRGDPTRRYLGCVYSVGRNAILGFSAVQGRYLLEFPREFLTGRAVRPQSTSLATLDLLPPHVRHARAYASVRNTNDFAAVSLLVRNVASPFVNATREVLAIPPRATASGEFEVSLNEAQEFSWHTTNDGGTGYDTTLALVGFDEEVP